MLVLSKHRDLLAYLCNRHSDLKISCKNIRILKNSLVYKHFIV
jgi:hypothetical protein